MTLSKDQLEEIQATGRTALDSDPPYSFLDRLKDERRELHKKISALVAFICTDKFDGLPVPMKALMRKQVYEMVDYRDILDARLEILEKEELISDYRV